MSRIARYGSTPRAVGGYPGGGSLPRPSSACGSGTAPRCAPGGGAGGRPGAGPRSLGPGGPVGRPLPGTRPAAGSLARPASGGLSTPKPVSVDGASTAPRLTQRGVAKCLSPPRSKEGQEVKGASCTPSTAARESVKVRNISSRYGGLVDSLMTGPRQVLMITQCIKSTLTVG